MAGSLWLYPNCAKTIPLFEPLLLLRELDTILTLALNNPPQSPFIKGGEKVSSPFSKGEPEPALVRLGWHISQPIKVALSDQSTSHFIKPGLGQGGFVVDFGSVEVLANAFMGDPGFGYVSFIVKAGR